VSTAALILPAFVEAARWDPAYWVEVRRASPAVDLVFVDDGSGDGTEDLLAASAEQVGGAVLRLDVNTGKAEAVRKGLLHALDAGARTVGFMDADGAFPAPEAQRLLDLLHDLQRTGPTAAVWSSRVALAGRDISRSMTRHYMGRIMATYVLRGFAGVPYDSQSGLKWFARSAALETILERPFETRWLFEVEMLARYREVTGAPLAIWEEPSSRWDEVGGSRVTRREVLRIAREARTAHRLLSQAYTEREGPDGSS
jgi:glycosyltransferase involved in cell wall biosynthesis